MSIAADVRKITNEIVGSKTYDHLSLKKQHVLKNLFIGKMTVKQFEAFHDGEFTLEAIGGEEHLQEYLQIVGLVAMTYNIDTNAFRLEGGVAGRGFRNWRQVHRITFVLDSLQRAIEAYRPHVLTIQEARKFTDRHGELVDSLTPVLELLTVNGYSTSVCPYDRAEGSFSYITAWKKDYYVSYETSIRYFNIDGRVPSNPNLSDDEKKARNFGIVKDRAMPFVHLLPRCDMVPIVVGNVHMDIPDKVRVAGAGRIREWITEFAEAGNRVVVLGDFNSFPDWKGPEQMAALEGIDIGKISRYCLAIGGASHTDRVEELKEQGQELPTFIATPYDFMGQTQKLDKEYGIPQVMDALSAEESRLAFLSIFETHCNAIGGRLDQVISSGFTHSDLELVIAARPDKELSAYTEEAVKAYLLECARMPDGGQPGFASDHQILMAHLDF